MTKDQYMEAHHHITESYIGLIRLHVMRGDLEMVRYCADKCSEELHEILEQRKNHWGVE